MLQTTVSCKLTFATAGFHVRARLSAVPQTPRNTAALAAEGRNQVPHDHTRFRHLLLAVIPTERAARRFATPKQNYREGGRDPLQTPLPPPRIENRERAARL
jgi:hypothetical protein